MIVYRLCRKEYAHDLSGEGARLHGGRWNSKGNAALYTSVYRSLSALEMAVHLGLSLNSSASSLVSIDIGDVDIINFPEPLPSGWDRFPFPSVTQKAGDTLLANAQCPGFKVPSVVVSEEFNIVLNPSFNWQKQLRIIDERAFLYDPRLESK